MRSSLHAPASLPKTIAVIQFADIHAVGHANRRFIVLSSEIHLTFHIAALVENIGMKRSMTTTKHNLTLLVLIWRNTNQACWFLAL